MPKSQYNRKKGTGSKKTMPRKKSGYKRKK